ncbi:MAG: PQQ-dependent sugar dehydrogenase [Verrucomicrobiota bacterium]
MKAWYLMVVVAGALVGATGHGVWAQSPAGMRVPWTTSRIKGSPEPPPPYQTEPVFPQLKFTNPVELVSAPGMDRLFVQELAGKMYSFPRSPDVAQPDLFADLKEIPRMRQAYGLAFHPGFATNRQVFICYVIDVNLPDGTRVSRFKVKDTNPPQLDLASEQILITWVSGGHNGGCLQFGNDGYLYISSGDAASPTPPDPLDTGQNLDDLMSCVLRIDVDRVDAGKAYRVPPDNPFVATPGARPEIWAYGFRNPWKMSFDRRTGDLWAGDVGWELWELVFRVERGGNYGWSIVEGPQSVHPRGRRGPTPILPAVAVHSHDEARSVTGGYVYRGKKTPELAGAYIYGDYVTGKIWGLRTSRGKVTWQQELANTSHAIICFGEDRDGELYVVDYAGTLHQLTRNTAADSYNPAFPARLSETGLFAWVKEHRLAPGVIPYAVQVELWEDHTTAERFVAAPGTAKLEAYTRNNLQAGEVRGNWNFPLDTVIARTVSLEMERGNPASKRRLETQVLHRHGDAWRAYNYIWNAAQTDAVLAGPGASEVTLDIKDAAAPGGLRRQKWRFASRGECNLCHVTRAGSILGFIPPQLEHTRTPGGMNQLRALEQIGLVERPAKFTALPAVTDSSASLEARARAYLYVNCGHCHRQGGGGTANFDLKLETPLAKARLLDEPPTQGAFGMTGAKIVAPGDPYRSVLLYRMAILGRGRMPQLGSTQVDETGLRLVRDWIASLPRTEKLVSLGKGRNSTHAPELPGTSSALKAACALDSPPSAETLKQALQGSPEVRALFLRFLPDAEREALTRMAGREEILAAKGDARRGREMFFREATQCINCHALESKGRMFGPDLRQIGKKYDRAQLLDSLLEPSKFVDPQFVTYQAETKDGEIHSGFLVKRGEDGVVLRDATGLEVRVPATKLERLYPSALSAMPEMLLQGMSAQEAADLLAFLEALKE